MTRDRVQSLTKFHGSLYILKPFNTAMGRHSQSGNGPSREPEWAWQGLMTIDEEPRYAVMLSAVVPTALLKNFAPQGILSLRNKSQSYFIATLSTEHYRFDFRLFGFVRTFLHDLFLDWQSLSPTYSVCRSL